MADKKNSVFDVKRDKYEFLISMIDGTVIIKHGRFSENEVIFECKKLSEGFSEKRDKGGVMYYTAHFIRWVRADKQVENIISKSKGPSPTATDQGQTS